MKAQKCLWIGLVGVLVLVALPGQRRAQAALVQSAFQEFERGYMIWAGDTGEIWVLAQNGQAMVFPEASYAALPDNPSADGPPAGYVKPVRGFGRVWGNFPTVRSLVGWGLQTEFGYQAVIDRYIAPVTGGNVAPTTVVVAFPNGRSARIRDGNRWAFDNTPRPLDELQPGSQFPATFQGFERGLMLWWSATGDIWVLENSGRATRYASVRYGRLPDPTITVTPPLGYYNPPQGFGKVWWHFPGVRSRLGFATGLVQGYVLTFQRVVSSGSSATVEYRVTLPDGRTVLINEAAGRWRFE